MEKYNFYEGIDTLSQTRITAEQSKYRTCCKESKTNCPHNYIENNMMPDTCRDCGKVLVEPVEECKRCGLLKSTVDSTKAKCKPDRRMGTILGGVHDFIPKDFLPLIN